jgi:hypothetical protein
MLASNEHADHDVAVESCEFWMGFCDAELDPELLRPFLPRLIPLLMKNMVRDWGRVRTGLGCRVSVWGLTLCGSSEVRPRTETFINPKPMHPNPRHPKPMGHAALVCIGCMSCLCGHPSR